MGNVSSGRVALKVFALVLVLAALVLAAVVVSWPWRVVPIMLLASVAIPFTLTLAPRYSQRHNAVTQAQYQQSQSATDREIDLALPRAAQEESAGAAPPY